MLNVLANQLDVWGYSQSDGLQSEDAESINDARIYAWKELRQKFSFDAVFFDGDIPVVYFKGLSHTPSNAELFDLHRKSWNFNGARVLIVVSPDRLVAIDCHMDPASSSRDATLSVLLDDIVAKAASAQHLLEKYSVHNIHATIRSLPPAENRVDRRLTATLSAIHARMVQSGIDRVSANVFTMQHIFVRYLIDRRIVTDYLLAEEGECITTTQALSNWTTYKTLLRFLEERFHGDLFVSEMGSLTEYGYQLALSLFAEASEGTNIDTGQLALWPYDFRFIPIDLIAGIYESMLADSANANAAIYTPLDLVEATLGEVIPWRASNLRVLDPACGSGTFLVQAFRRLAFGMTKEHSVERLSPKRLVDLLVSSVFGVDIDETAVQIAIFSCYMALLEQLEPTDIWVQLSLPRLLANNFWVGDFFDTENPLNANTYDIIVGNPPWISRLTRHAESYIKTRGYDISDNQVAQAFMWKTGEMLSNGGRASLVLPAKSVLFNSSPKSRKFRKSFLAEHRVLLIVDLSAFRGNLFASAGMPACVITFAREDDDSGGEYSLITYAAPKTRYAVARSGALVTDATDIRRIPKSSLVSALDAPNLLVWGRGREEQLWSKLAACPLTLEGLVKREKWAIGEGMQEIGSERNYRPNRIGMPVVRGQPFDALAIDASKLDRLISPYFHRPRKNERIFEGPLMLIRKGVDKGEARIHAAFSERSTLYTNAFVGISSVGGNDRVLQAVTTLLNSSVVAYYQFMKSSRWGIDRNEVLTSDLLTTPIPIDFDKYIGVLAGVVESAQRMSDPDCRASINEIAYRVYNLSKDEVSVVESTISWVIPRAVAGAKPIVPPAAAIKVIGHYTDTLTRVISNSFGVEAVARIWTGLDTDSSLHAVNISLTEQPLESTPRSEPNVQPFKSIGSEEIDNALDGRDMFVYATNSVTIVKKSDRLKWTTAAALNDADQIVESVIQFANSDFSEEAVR